MGAVSNFIIANIECEYLVMLHDDDVLYPDYVKETLSLIESDKNIAYVGTSYNLIDENGKIIGKIGYSKLNKQILAFREYFVHHIKGLFFQWSGTLIRKNKIKSLRFDFKKNPYCADSIFFARLAINNKVGYINKILFSYRLSNSQVTSKMLTGNFNLIFNEWIANINFYQEIFTEMNMKETKKLHLNNASNTLASLAIQSPDKFWFYKIIKHEYFKFSHISVFLKMRLLKKLFIVSVSNRYPFLFNLLNSTNK